MIGRQEDGVTVPQGSRVARALLLVVVAGLFGVLAGTVGASGQPVLTLALVGLAIVALIVSSRVAVFWFVLIGALVVTGVTQLYMPWSQARHVRYVVPLATLALLLHWVLDRISAKGHERNRPIPTPIAWALAFALVSVISVLVNVSDPIVALVGTKNYIQMWGLFLCVAFLRWDASFARSLLKGLLLIALLQLPFAAHQYFFLVPQRIGLGEGIVPADVVAGTFGASLVGGGANAVLAAFQVIMVAFLLAMWKNGAVSLMKALVLSVLLLTPLLVNQAKIAGLYLPLIFVVLFYRDIVLKPLKFMLAGAAMAAVVAALITALTLTNPTGKPQTWSELIEQVVARQTAEVHERKGLYSELSRWSALTFWAQEHVKANPVNTLIGHGLGESREQERGLDLAHTLAENRYSGLRIGTTAVSALLWDTGIIGLITVLGMYVSAFLMAGRMARHFRGKDRFRTGLFEGLQASIAVLTLSLAHKDFFVVHIPYQTLTYLLIGLIANSWLEVNRSEHGSDAA